jgi:undecaprenyl-diphosphatase
MDQHLLFLINHRWTAPWLDTPMAAASSWDLWWPFLVVAGLLVAVRGGFHARAFLLVAGLAVGVTDGVVTDTLKDIVGRPRPHETVQGVRTLDLAKATPRFLALGKPLKAEHSVPGILPPKGNSFPSGHASNNFALATVVVLFFPGWGWLAFLPAACVAYSRIYVGSHWPSDVIVSAFLGAGVALLVCATVEMLWRWAGGRWLPRFYLAHPSLLGR